MTVELAATGNYPLFGKKLSHLPAENEKRDNRAFGRKEVILADKIMVS